jgi:hypothetical protein
LLIQEFGIRQNSRKLRKLLNPAVQSRGGFETAPTFLA